MTIDIRSHRRRVPSKADRSERSAPPAADRCTEAPPGTTKAATTGPDPVAPTGRASWRVWGTSVTLLVQPARSIATARQLLHEEIRAMDAACSRFRPDSELSRLNRTVGRPMPISRRFLDALQTAQRTAERTGGAVDPTVGTALLALGYDRDYDEVAAGAPTLPLGAPPTPAAGWRALVVDPARRTALLPPGVSLDLGATAKALCADRAAARIAEEIGGGVLVDLGGDLSTAGPPPIGGWQISVVDDARSGRTSEACVVALWRGGMASSGTSVRTWTRAGWPLHHIIDPATGWPAEPVWRTVTVAAPSCVDANTASTAAVIWGEEAPFHIAQLGLAARFVRADGAVREVGGWPGA